MGKIFKEALSGIIGSFLMFVLMAVFAKFNYFNSKADKDYVDAEILELKTLNEEQHKQFENTNYLILQSLKRIESNQDKLMMQAR